MQIGLFYGFGIEVVDQDFSSLFQDGAFADMADDDVVRGFSGPETGDLYLFGKLASRTCLASLRAARRLASSSGWFSSSTMSLA